MDEAKFASFLKRGGRSSSAITRCIRYAQEFERYLLADCAGSSLDEASPEDLEAFVGWLEQTPKFSAKTHLWALCYYYEYVSNEEMRYLAGALREQRIRRTPFPLHKFQGVDPEITDKLAAAGIRNVNHILQAGSTASARQNLSEKTRVPGEAILELVKLSDLARIPGMKGIRARLYHDAGVDTVEKLACSDPEELGAMFIDFVERTGFDGIAPLPKEIAFSVRTAKHLPNIVDY
jgi:hypothetical protein